MEELLRPAPNQSVKLFFYNRIDTAKHNKQVERKKAKYKKKNIKREAREDRINRKRILAAKEDGDSLYKHKIIPPKNVKLGWRHWVRENLGQPPILLDSAKVEKSRKQLNIYLKKKGFYYGSVSDTIIFKEKKQKAYVKYTVKPGKPYLINEIRFDSLTSHTRVMQEYQKFTKENGLNLQKGDLLDQDELDTERERFASYLRNESAMFGFNKNYIGFAVDTTLGDYKADVYLYVKPKIVEDPNNPDEDMVLEHKTYKVKAVTFYLHNPDTASFKDYARFKAKCDSLGLPYYDGEHYQLLDTMTIVGKGTFVYNEIPYVKPALLDKQNFLEIDGAYNPNSEDQRFYKEYYVERSYRTLSNLGVFLTITPEVKIDPEDPLGRWVVVSYDLTPLKKQSFLFEPRVENTNSILGIFGTVSYSNKNLFRGAQQLKISLIGGGESQPLIVRDEGDDSAPFWQLNTFEWEPEN